MTKSFRNAMTTNGVVPPSAAILAVAVLLGADVGLCILWGLIICLAALLIIYALTIKWMTKNASYAAPKPEFTVGIEPVGENASIAMLIGIIILIVTNVKIKNKMLVNANRTEAIDMKASLLELGMGNWAKRAIDVSAMVLMVTAMGAAFASVLSSQPVVSEIAEVVAQSGIPMIMIPFIIAAVMRAAAGSMATASMAAAGICLPIMATLGLSPVAVTLAIGLGTVLFGHVNDSGCWMCQEVFNVNLEQYLKYVREKVYAGREGG